MAEEKKESSERGESKDLLVKLNIIDVFNEVIEFLAEIQVDGRVLPRNLQVLDMKYEMLRLHLTAIGQRALEIKDPILMARLVAIGILTDKEDEEQVRGNA
jgi:hypothetical protein